MKRCSFGITFYELSSPHRSFQEQLWYNTTTRIKHICYFFWGVDPSLSLLIEQTGLKCDKPFIRLWIMMITTNWGKPIFSSDNSHHLCLLYCAYRNQFFSYYEVVTSLICFHSSSLIILYCTLNFIGNADNVLCDLLYAQEVLSISILQLTV